MPPIVHIAELSDRGIVRVSGPDARKLLQGLVTNDLEAHDPTAPIFAGLLSPQGKILFDFFIVPSGETILIDILRESVAAFIKRLAMYKLRADVAISDMSSELKVLARWSEGDDAKVEDLGAVDFADPRELQLGTRIIASQNTTGPTLAPTSNSSAWDERRVALGVPEGGKDYAFGDAYPHDADFDVFNGVSFTKGCYVGQEIVARMQHKSVVRKRVIKIVGDAPLQSGADILLGEVPIGRVGTVAGTEGLAMLRLDRVLEAEQKAISLTAGETRVRPQSALFERFRGTATANAPGQKT